MVHGAAAEAVQAGSSADEESPKRLWSLIPNATRAKCKQAQQIAGIVF